MAGITVSDIMNANQLWTTSATSWAEFPAGDTEQRVVP